MERTPPPLLPCRPADGDSGSEVSGSWGSVGGRGPSCCGERIHGVGAQVAKGFVATVPGAKAGRKPANGAAALSRTEETRLRRPRARGDAERSARSCRWSPAPAYRFSMGFCRNTDDAEDLVRDVMATLLRSLDLFRVSPALDLHRGQARVRPPAPARQAADVARGPESDRGRPSRSRAGAQRAAPRTANCPRRSKPRSRRCPTRRSRCSSCATSRVLSAAEVGKVLGLGERAR